MEADTVIIGGGVAGLAAMNRLVDLGKKPLLIDGGMIPSHKVCGEFFSSPCHQILKEWGMAIKPTISCANFHCGEETLSFPLSAPSFSMSHLEFDKFLLDRAVNMGATVMTETKIEGWKSNDEEGGFLLTLDQGRTVTCKKLLIASGRMTQKATTSLPYFGVKGHVSGKKQSNSSSSFLEMFIFPEGYFGVAEVKPGVFNIAGVLKGSKEQGVALAEKVCSNLDLGELLFPEWMTTPIPEFGPKLFDAKPGLYPIGDAIGTIPPITGLGMTLAIHSALLAADAVVKGDERQYKRAWEKRFIPVIKKGMILHHLMLQPVLSKFGFKIGHYFPKIPLYIHRLIEKSIHPQTPSDS